MLAGFKKVQKTGRADVAICPERALSKMNGATGELQDTVSSCGL